MNGVLATCDAESDALMMEELRAFKVAHLPGQWLDTGDTIQGSILLVESDLDFEAFSHAVRDSIFIRHLAPVEYAIPLSGTEADVQTVAEWIPELAKRLDSSESFSVQSRVLGEGKLPFRKVVLNETISQGLEAATGAEMDCRWPSQVISILCSPTVAYLGVSKTELNRSAWPGGKHRFKKDDDQVSRAEFKLLEAMSVFGIELPTQGRGLDIGASPGGWTRVLADRGLQVDAVDPGDLDQRLRGNRRITHLRKRIQEYNPGSKTFAAIVNDMKMDARDSIAIMLDFSPRLAPGGTAVMTLKMPKAGQSSSAARRTLEMLHEDLAQLATGYEVVGARQLYHNRSEVTVALRSQAAR